MKQKAAILCAAALVLALAGCAPQSGTSSAPGVQQTAESAAPSSTEAPQSETQVLLREVLLNSDGTVRSETRYRYNDAGQLIEAVGGARTLYEYDDAGNLVRERQFDCYGVFQEREFLRQYDAAGDLVREELWYRDCLFRTIVYRYSSAENGCRRVEATTEDGEVYCSELWDSEGRTLERTWSYEPDQVQHFSYDEHGNMTAQDNARYTYEYEDGRIAAKNCLDADGTLSYRIAYEYAPLQDALAEIDLGGDPVTGDLGGIELPQYLIPQDCRVHYQTTAENNLVLRSGPGTEYDRLDGIPYLTEIVQIGYTNGLPGWFVTQYNGQYGWVSSEFVATFGEMEKPVLCLYPQQPTQVEVTLTLPGGRLTCTYPDYRSSWQVLAQPDGTLTNLADGLEYSYLYWEGEGPARWDFSQGFVVPGSETAGFLRQSLSAMGLTPREYNEFIVYWLPRMQANPYNLISFQQETYTESALLRITPEPDSVLRVFMAYRPLMEPVEVPPQTLPTFQREGFAVVEWGGTCVE